MRQYLAGGAIIAVSLVAMAFPNPEAPRTTANSPSGATSKRIVASEAVKKLLAAHTWDSLGPIADEWRSQLTPEQQSALVGELLRQVSRIEPCELASDGRILVAWRRKAGLQELTRTPDAYLYQDVFTVGGRCAWAIQQLLDCEFSVWIRGDMRPEEAAEAKSLIVSEAVTRMRMPETTNIVTLSVERRRQLGTDRDTPLSVLRRLASDPEMIVRAAIASNPMTPLDTLAKMAESDEDEQVRKLAKENREIIRSRPHRARD